MEQFQGPMVFFLVLMTIILVATLLSEKVRLPGTVKKMEGSLRINDLHKHTESDLLVIPGFGSRQRFLANIGNLPERLALAFEGNMILLHFDR